MKPLNTYQTESFLPYMRDVIRCEQSLHELNLMWRIIESSAKMNCSEDAKSILPTMAETRQGFNRLEHELVLSLVHQKVSTVIEEIGTKAHYIIDLLVRNLYERTADVGFLATDNELCSFVAGLHGNADVIRMRLRAYANKYTVYDEIILLDDDGNVLVQINPETPIEGSTDPLIKATMQTDGYVETYRASDLRPHHEKSLIYSKRMHHPITGEPIGVLCLCFNFSEEMAGIFSSHGDPTGRSVMLLVDEQHHVIESSDHRWISKGSYVPMCEHQQEGLVMYCGRQYLACSFFANEYQGYLGPRGWRGQVMTPIDVAFTAQESEALLAIDAVMAEGLLSHAKSFCPPLYEIMNAAESIKRVVWNGQVTTAGQGDDSTRLKTILDQISETGVRSNELFSQSINELYETVLASKLQDSEFVSKLLVDILDRNLYERSNDCRWWALTPELKTILASGQFDQTSIQKMTGILTYINQLYTVYTRVFVYDKLGKIVASTGEDTQKISVVGTYVPQDTLDKVRLLRNEQEYVVSAFQSTDLYDQAATYVYHAAVRSPDGNMIVGGIGIGFDATPEFLAMLHAGINGVDSVKAFYIDRAGNILSSTDPTRPVGTQLIVDTEMMQLSNGASASKIVVHDAHYAIMGCSVSSGYREFKVNDGYQDDIIAVVFYMLGEEREFNHQNSGLIIEGAPIVHESLEFAIFTINGSFFALEVEFVLEAIAASEISPVSMGASAERVGLLPTQVEADNSYVWVYDLAYLLTGVSTQMNTASQVVVVKFAGQKIGLLVNALNAVTAFDLSQISMSPLIADGKQVLVKKIIQANQGKVLVQWLDIAVLYKFLMNTDVLLAG
jgi:chemotaxis signal transduction protein